MDLRAREYARRNIPAPPQCALAIRQNLPGAALEIEKPVHDPLQDRRARAGGRAITWCKPRASRVEFTRLPQSRSSSRS